MKTYKVYFRHNGELTHGFFQSPTLEDIYWRVLARFYNAAISKVVEVRI